MKQLIAGMALTMAVLGVQAADYSLGDDNWEIPIDPILHSQESLYDSDPINRNSSLNYLRDRLGYSSIRLTSADRFHLLFSTGEASITKSEEQKLKIFLQNQKADDEVVIVGYTDYSGPDRVNRDLASDRAASVGSIVLRALPDAKVTFGATTHWTGHQSEARRVDVFLVPPL